MAAPIYLRKTDEADLTYFLLHQLSVVMRALDSLHEYISRKTREIRTSGERAARN